jgi:hypothetical protein
MARQHRNDLTPSPILMGEGSAVRVLADSIESVVLKLTQNHKLQLFACQLLKRF